MGIFVTGFVAVAAIFPTAIAVQRETVDDQMARGIGVNAESIIFAMARSRGGPLTYTHNPTSADRSGTLAPYTREPAQGGRVYSLLGVGVWTPNSLKDSFTPALRTYPAYDDDVENRDYVWYPFIQVKGDLTSQTSPVWLAYVMILRRTGIGMMPEIREVLVQEDTSQTSRILFTSPAADFNNDADGDGIPDLISPGNWVLGDDGGVHQVVLADSGSITVDSPVVQQGTVPLQRLYYAVGLEKDGTTFKREARSPILRIEGPFNVLPEPSP